MRIFGMVYFNGSISSRKLKKIISHPDAIKISSTFYTKSALKKFVNEIENIYS